VRGNCGWLTVWRHQKASRHLTLTPRKDKVYNFIDFSAPWDLPRSFCFLGRRLEFMRWINYARTESEEDFQLLRTWGSKLRELGPKLRDFPCLSG